MKELHTNMLSPLLCTLIMRRLFLFAEPAALVREVYTEVFLLTEVTSRSRCFLLFFVFFFEMQRYSVQRFTRLPNVRNADFCITHRRMIQSESSVSILRMGIDKVHFLICYAKVYAPRLSLELVQQCSLIRQACKQTNECNLEQ